MIVGIIPARKNSKRIKNKNIKIFNGKPIIAWTIEKAIKSNIFDKIIVSTDSDKIANISLKYGAEISFKRPKNLSDDYSTLVDVMAHASGKCNDVFNQHDYACLLFATAPFISSQNLKEGFKKIKSNKFDYVLAISKFDFPIQRGLMLIDNKIKMINQKNFLKRSQDLLETFHDAGQFCFGKSKNWIKKKNIFKSHTSFVEIDKWRCQDIDNLNDWRMAEKLFKLNFNEIK